MEEEREMTGWTWVPAFAPNWNAEGVQVGDVTLQAKQGVPLSDSEAAALLPPPLPEPEPKKIKFREFL